MLRGSLLIMVALGIFLTQCESVKAPRGTVPKRKQIATTAFGGWMTLSFVDTTRQTVEGEFIAYHNDSVYVMVGGALDARATAEVRQARIILFETEASGYGAWTALTTLLSFSNGGFLIFTAPLTLITGIATTAGESKRINYYDYPAHEWAALRKYARFPQGIPQGLALHDLKPARMALTTTSQNR